MISKYLLLIRIFILVKQQTCAEIENIAELYDFYSTNNSTEKGLEKNGLHKGSAKNITELSNFYSTDNSTEKELETTTKLKGSVNNIAELYDFYSTDNSTVNGLKRNGVHKGSSKNIAELYDFYSRDNSKVNGLKRNGVHKGSAKNIAELYDFYSTDNSTEKGLEKNDVHKGSAKNITELYNFYSTDNSTDKSLARKEVLKASVNRTNKLEDPVKKSTKDINKIENSYATPITTQTAVKLKTNNTTFNENEQNTAQTPSERVAFSNETLKTKAANSSFERKIIIGNIADLYDFVVPPRRFKDLENNQTFVNTSKIYTKTPNNIENIADLYFFNYDSPTGIFNCSFEDTINITDEKPLPNGSYLYENRLLVPPNLIGVYDYEILYDGMKHLVAPHTRACICHLKNCLTLCSDSILQFYEDASNAGDKEFLQLFSIPATLSNGSVVLKNIVNDFEHIVLDDFCEPFYPLSPEKDSRLSWTLFENGTLLRHSDHMYLRKTEYCFELYEDKFGNTSYYLINPLNCAKENDKLSSVDRFNNWIQVASIPFFIVIIIAYICLPELRNVHGKCFISYLGCLTLSYGLLSYINLSKNPFHPVPCSILAYSYHYMQLSHYTWLGIICYDTWKSCGSTLYEPLYWKYALYGFGLPLLLTLMTFAAQHSHLPNDWKPGITQFKCGLEVNSWAAFLYLFGPCLMVLLYCLRAFCLTYTIIQSNDKKVTDINCESTRNRYFLYLRLFLMMGLSWFLDVISYFVSLFGLKFVAGLIDYINAMQGLFLFASFIGRKCVRIIIRQRLNIKYRRMPSM